MKGSTIGRTHPVEEVYSVRRNIAADAARKGKPSVDNCALLLTSDDWLRFSRGYAPRDHELPNRFRSEYINYEWKPLAPRQSGITSSRRYR